MADEPQRFCLGIAYMPGPDPRITKGADGGRDWISESELEKAAWSYLRNGPQVNAFHVAGTEGCATTVESSIHRGPDWDLGDGIVVRKGTWLVGAILDERMWQAAQAGKVNGWSPEGTARRRKVRKEGAVTIAKSALPADGDEEFSELTACDFPTMGLVGKGANGIPRFLVMKDAEGGTTGLLDPEFVRDLIAKAEPGPEPPDDAGQVTMTGSPAAIAAFIHKASVRAAEPDDVAKRSADESEAGQLVREAVAKAVLAGCEDLFPGYLAPVKEPVMVGTEHDDVLKTVCAAVFPGHDVADVAGSLVPAAQRAAVKKLAADCLLEGRPLAVDGKKAPSEFPGMAGALTALRAVSRVGPHRGVIRELGSADLASLRKSVSAPGDARRELVFTTAVNATENCSGVTLGASGLDGSAAGQAGFRHGFSLHEQIVKAEMTSRSTNDLPDSAFAYIESGGKKDADGKTTPRSLRHFPINDAAHVRNALARLSSSPFGDKAAGKVKAAARKFGIEVSKEAGVPETVTKDMGPDLDDGVDGMDPTVVLAEPDEMGPGDMTDPGSPAWESIDAATAQKWTSIAVRLKNALCVLAEREMLEAASADPGDAENAFDLQDAMCAVDYVIDTLAGFAVDEQAEADLCGEAMEAVGKSAGDAEVLTAIRKAMEHDDLTAAALTKLETFAVIAKSGRVLSSVNEAHIREAATRLNTVLSSLPQAPITDDGQPVAKSKETTVDAPETAQDPSAIAEVAKDGAPSPDEQARDTGPVNAGGTMGMGIPKGGTVEARPGDTQVPGREVMKADGDGGKPAQVAVYDADGNLVGVANPDDITPLANVKAPASDDANPDGADAAPAPDPSDMTPAPPAETGTPADAVADDDVAKQDQIALTQDVLKSIAQDAARTALEAQGAAHQEVIAKMAADKDELAEELRVVKARLETVENTPAAPKVFTNGQTPPAHQLRGQDQGAAQPVDVAKARERKREFYTATATEQNRMAGEMQQDAIAALEAIHQQRRPA